MRDGLPRPAWAAIQTGRVYPFIFSKTFVRDFFMVTPFLAHPDLIRLIKWTRPVRLATLTPAVGHCSGASLPSSSSQYSPRGPCRPRYEHESLCGWHFFKFKDIHVLVWKPDPPVQ